MIYGGILLYTDVYCCKCVPVLMCGVMLLMLWAVAMLQADDEDDMMEQQMKSPFGSSFRTFDATDYKPIGKTLALSPVCVLLARFL